VQSLNGRYITAEDVNTSTRDMSYVAMETSHVVGLEGKSGNPSPITALGVFNAVKAGINAAITAAIYKPLSRLIKGTSPENATAPAHMH